MLSQSASHAPQDVSGVFNGPLVSLNSPTHRARIPSYASVSLTSPSLSLVACGIDLRNATFYALYVPTLIFDDGLVRRRRGSFSSHNYDPSPSPLIFPPPYRYTSPQNANVTVQLFQYAHRVNRSLLITELSIHSPVALSILHKSCAI